MRILVLFIFLASYPVFSQNLNISNGLVFDGEPFIAINPQNNQHLVVAWMGFRLGQKVVIKTKASFDGGETWSSTSFLPHTQEDNGSADPSLYFDNNNTVYLCYIDYDNNNFQNGSVVVAKSTDGITWSDPVVAIDITDCPNKLCIDRPWMVIDQSDGNYTGTIYITSMTPDNPSVSGPFHPYFTQSVDGGDTFEPVRVLDTVGFESGNEIKQPMPTPTVSANGTFHAIYPAYDPGLTPFPRYIHVSSSDGGTSFNYNLQELVTQQTGFNQFPNTKKAPLLINNPSDENHLAYILLRVSGNDFNVYCSESLNAGQTWSSLKKVNDNPIGNGVVHDLIWGDFNDDGDLVVCWRDRRKGGAGFNVGAEIMAAVKRKDENNFSENFLISDSLIAHDNILANSGNDFMCLSYVADTIHAVWGDVRTGTINIFYNKLIVSEQTANIKKITQEDWRFKALYPNPANEFIMLDEAFVTSKYVVYNTMGQQMLKGVVHENASIYVADLPKGNYYIVLQNTEGEVGFQFMK